LTPSFCAMLGISLVPSFTSWRILALEVGQCSGECRAIITNCMGCSLIGFWMREYDPSIEKTMRSVRVHYQARLPWSGGSDGLPRIADSGEVYHRTAWDLRILPAPAATQFQAPAGLASLGIISAGFARAPSAMSAMESGLATSCFEFLVIAGDGRDTGS
jgi:hypothetical protein